MEAFTNGYTVYSKYKFIKCFWHFHVFFLYSVYIFKVFGLAFNLRAP